MLLKRFSVKKSQLRYQWNLKKEYKVKDLNCEFKHFENEKNKMNHFIFDSNSNMKKNFSILFKTSKVNEKKLSILLSSILISKFSPSNPFLKNLQIQNSFLLFH
jgi:hypothetical protein